VTIAWVLAAMSAVTAAFPELWMNALSPDWPLASALALSGAASVALGLGAIVLVLGIRNGTGRRVWVPPLALGAIGALVGANMFLAGSLFTVFELVRG
jgi:hypothetical protein